MKICRNCSTEKQMTEYYAHPNSADGHMPICKECHKARVRQNRADRIDYYQQYDRDRAYDPDRVAARKDYWRRTKVDQKLRAAANENRRAWVMRHSEKRLAHVIAGNAIRDGRLTKQPCERCGELRVEAHHEDYNKPLEVTWLCKPCHMMRHREINRQKREAA